MAEYSVSQLVSTGQDMAAGAMQGSSEKHGDDAFALVQESRELRDIPVNRAFEIGFEEDERYY